MNRRNQVKQTYCCAPRSGWLRAVQMSLFLLAVLGLTGCVSSRGAMYLHADPIKDYLAREQKPKAEDMKDKDKVVEGALVNARKMLQDVPDANRRLGGFCGKPAVVKQIRRIQDVAPACRMKLKVYQNTSNLHGAIFWGLLGGTAVTGIAAALGGFLGPDDAKVGLTLGFGIPMVLMALTNGFGPFARWQDTYKYQANRLDNYMWSMRVRLSQEVCNAENLETAVIKARKIVKDVKRQCESKLYYDGLYRPGSTDNDQG